MSGGDYFRALFVVLVGGSALCLVLMCAVLAFYGVRRLTTQRRTR